MAALAQPLLVAKISACNCLCEQARRFRPFGAGVRNCLGQQLAYTNIPTALAMLVANFRMELSEEVRACACCGIVASGCGASVGVVSLAGGALNRLDMGCPHVILCS